ncbi:alpha-2,8-polysialyltransferase family protein, partial [Escherichia coli]|nr:alpha-2,8-polysialyltransferase family protein [Escherichia coli]
GFGLMREADMQAVTAEIRQWLAQQGMVQIDYKGHPKDRRRELSQPEYNVIELDEPLETYLAQTAYDAVVGVRSSALLFARQIYGPDTRVV